MNVARQLLAKRYATAFLNVFFKELSAEAIEHLQALATFMKNHSEGLFYVKLSCIKQSIKQEVLFKLFEKFDLADEPYRRLLALLAHDRRLFLLPLIIEHILILYKERAGILDATIASSHPLEHAYQQKLEQLIKETLHKTIHYHYTISPALIAGVRLTTNSLLWEYSVRQQLLALKRIE